MNDISLDQDPFKSRTSGTNFVSRNQGLSVYSLIETIALFVTLAAVDVIFLDGTAGQISPQLFWIPVILLSAQYGTVSGLIAAILSIALVQYSTPALQGLQEDYYTYVARVSTLPALWLGAAILLGEMRTRHIVEHNRILAQLHDLEIEHQCFADYCRTLNSEIEGLEHIIAIQETPKQPVEPSKVA